MKIRFWNNKSNISWRRFYLPLIILPTILGIILSITVFIVTRGQLNRTGQITVEKFSAQASGVLNELKITNDSLMSNDQLISLLTHDILNESDLYTIVRILRNQLNRSSYVQDTMVISSKHDKTYTSDGYYSYSSAMPLLVRAGALPSEYEPFIEDDLHEGWSVPDNGYSSPYFVSYIYNSDAEKTGTLVIILNKAYLYRSLFSTNSDYCCMYNKDFLISSIFNTDTGIDYTSKADISRLVGSPVEIFSAEDEHYDYLVALKRSDFLRPLYIIIIAFALYFLVVLIFAAIHIRNSNRREKEFFSSLISELPQPVSSNDDLATIFASIRNALENYKEEHQAFSEQQKYSNLEKLAMDYSSASIDGAEAAAMDIDSSALCYYMIRFHYSEEGIMNPAHRRDLTCIITETSMNGFAEGRFKAVCFPQKNGDVCGILNVYDKDLKAEDIHVIVRHVRTLMEKDYGIVFKCSLSAAVTNINDIPKAFQETLDLFRFVRAIDSNVRFVSADDMKNSPTFLIKDKYLKQLQILSGTLLLGKYDLVPGMVDTMLEEHVAPLRQNFSMANERLQCIINILHETPLPGHLSEEEVRTFHDRLSQADSIAALSQTAHEEFSILQSVDIADSIVEKAQDYITEQISNDMLSVPEIAEHVGVSVQHLSKRFKETTGMTMVEYINLYRINKAKDLLSTTNLNQSEISAQAGYCNNVTFTRNFKKYVGCTPSEYRNRS